MSSKTEQKKIYWSYLLVAFLLAIGVWYILNAKDQVERRFDVPLDYTGLPANLVVTDGQLSQVSIRIKGPSKLLHSEGRERSYTVDLSGMAPGDNTINLAYIWRDTPVRAVELLEVNPPRLVLHVEAIQDVKVPVNVKLRSSPVTPSLQITDLVVEPAMVTVRGPASTVSGVKEIVAEIPADLLGEGREVTDEVPLQAPAGLDVIPQTVKVQRILDVKRRKINLQRDIVAEDENVIVQPSNCSLVVSVPRSLVRDGNYLSQFMVTVPSTVVVPVDGSPVEARLEVSLPQGGEIVRLTPETVFLRYSGAFPR